jgi:hypothetical protein
LLNCHIPEQTWLKEAAVRNEACPAGNRRRGVAKAQEVSAATRWESIVARIEAFQHLKDNGDSQGPQAPTAELLTSAIGLACTLHQQGVEAPTRVVPGPVGSVIFEWQDLDGTYTEVEVIRPFYAEVMVIQPGQPAKHWTWPTPA